jgi:hypothetical protein
MRSRFFLSAILGCVVLLGSCAGTKALGIFDESIPEADLCNLEIRNSLSVILFNNQPVEWAPGLSENKVTIALPSGEHTFEVRYYVKRVAGYNLYESVPQMKSVSMEFVPGHNYRIYKQDIWIVIGTITKIKIKDVTPRT